MMRKYLIVLIGIVGIYTAKGQAESCACCTVDHIAFDFWIGTWEVTNTDGSAAGTSLIEKVQNGCILQESWTSADGKYTGTSNNFYNLTTHQWEQLWIDNYGVHIHLKGNRKDNQMILLSDEFVQTDGKEYRNRITWTLNEDGTVRQLWEVLQGEIVASVSFDGLYVKLK